MNKKLIDWSQKHYSHLPWRKNRTLYTTLVSEIMLQQTTVSTVLQHFNRFINQYPNIESLAKISEDEILSAWSGLGYYRRARNLLSAAKEIQTKFQSKIPLEYDQLIGIKGIGSYTANALLSIGADKKTLALDANLERVIARYYGLMSIKGIPLQKEIQEKFQQGIICQEMIKLSARDFNEALMDLGRVICKARSASCEICPLSDGCVSKNNPLMYPIGIEKNINSSHSFDLHLVRLILRKNKKILGYKKNQNEWLTNQIELPTFILESSDQSLKQYPVIRTQFSFLINAPYIVTHITKYKIYNHVVEISDTEAKKLGLAGYQFFLPEEANFSTASRKCLKFI